MPLLASTPFPDANSVLLSLLSDLAPTSLRVPNDFTPPLIVVRRIGGQPDAEDVTDYPIMLVSVFGDTYLDAQALMGKVQVRILTSPLTAVTLRDATGNGVGRVLIDSAGIHIGETELPGAWPDDRRLNATYQLGFRRGLLPIG